MSTLEPTFAEVKKAVAKAFPGVVLQKGNGYYYFTGEPVECAYTSSVYVYRTTHLPLDHWIECAREIVNDSAQREAELNATAH